ncbi:hypothetical protein GGQ84_002734 [Desulfitispora alkaliphila]|uniref:hypothetical protein n=1 Tax=Desulfitispora alkaliphila TaxID=622674 RepID=UPI003D1DDAF0
MADDDRSWDDRIGGSGNTDTSSRFGTQNVNEGSRFGTEDVSKGFGTKPELSSKSANKQKPKTK